jgi:hypothetical protein
LEQSRYALWATLATENQTPEEKTKNEIGLYTTLQELESDQIAKALRELLNATIMPVLGTGITEISETLIARCGEILKSRIADGKTKTENC